MREGAPGDVIGHQIYKPRVVKVRVIRESDKNLELSRLARIGVFSANRTINALV